MKGEEMSSVIVEERLDELDALDEERAIHLYDLTVLFPYTICGGFSPHSCIEDQRWEPGMTHCEVCKRPVCAICALLSIDFHNQYMKEQNEST